MKNNSAPNSEIVETLSPAQRGNAPWNPIVGVETLDLLDHLKLSESNKQTLQTEALSVLSRCMPPSTPNGKETGLVIGYVQSGKTMSFTTVAALACDNNFRLIIIFTGITRNLFEQSRDRLKEDLRIVERTDRKWQFFDNPKARPDIRQRIGVALESDGSVPGIGKQTVLITVMKNATHLKNLTKLLGDLNLTGIPVLVIDDEADQASLNNKVRQGNESATYRRIVEIRQLLPHHTFLQYTATPQALLLINIIDVLSPRFVELLTPGSTYTGGKEFFEGNFDLIRPIPQNDIPTSDLPMREPPSSLLEAMRVFFLGVAADISRNRTDNRSMMVHPAKQTMQHANYAQWVRQIQFNWSRILSLTKQDPDYQELLADFAVAYEDLHRTANDLVPFEDLVPFLAGAVKITGIIEVNAARGRTPQPDWHQQYAHIVVGGEVLNRGYTLKGLTVTYMPRSKGLGNADTIQQRARWFGYKADYLGYCRVYLASEALRAYQNYVCHEESIRDQLRKYRDTGKSLREWRRAFFLSSDLQPTRRNVLDLEYTRGNFSNSWFDPVAPHDSEEAIQANQQIVSTFISHLSFQSDEGHPKRTAVQRHLIAYDIRLSSVFRDLLAQLRFTRLRDSQQFTGLLLQLGEYLEQHPDAVCTIYQMSQGKTRERSVNEEDEISQLYQGPNYDGDQETYPGDRHVRAAQGVTVQIHNLKLKGKGRVWNDVPLVAVWVPRDLSRDWIAQERIES